MDITAQTLVLIDNSLSVSKANREITKLTLQYLFKHSNEGRSYCFTSFSHEMDYVENYTDDYTALEDMASRLEYENKETSITDVVSSVLDKWEKSDFACRDILIFTDGMEEKSLYYEKEELYYLLEHCSYPVYIVCLDQKDNESKYKNLSVITRLSGGELFHTEFEDSEAEVERKLSEQIQKSMDSYAASHWEVYEKDSADEECEENGKSKEPEDEEIDESEIPENEITSVTNIEEMGDFAFSGVGDEENVIYEMTKEDTFGTPMSYAIIGGAFFIVLCAIGLSLCLVIRHKKNLEREDEEYRRIIQEKLREDRGDISINSYYSGTGSDYGENKGYKQEKRSRSSGNGGNYSGKYRIGETVALVNREPEEEDYSTRLLFSDSGCSDITFEDANDPSKYFRISPKGRIILGRARSKCDLAFEYDDSVSSRHCELYMRDGNWYVRDLDSSNGTMLNGDKVFTESSISSGDMLQIGSLMLIVRFT